jgi:hypothetical protein
VARNTNSSRYGLESALPEEVARAVRDGLQRVAHGGTASADFLAALRELKTIARRTRVSP